MLEKNMWFHFKKQSWASHDFRPSPTEKLITSKYTPLEAIRLLSETSSDIVNSTENIPA